MLTSARSYALAPVLMIAITAFIPAAAMAQSSTSGVVESNSSLHSSAPSPESAQIPATTQPSSGPAGELAPGAGANQVHGEYGTSLGQGDSATTRGPTTTDYQSNTGNRRGSDKPLAPTTVAVGTNDASTAPSGGMIHQNSVSIRGTNGAPDATPSSGTAGTTSSGSNSDSMNSSGSNGAPAGSGH